MAKVKCCAKPCLVADWDGPAGARVYGYRCTNCKTFTRAGK